MDPSMRQAIILAVIDKMVLGLFVGVGWLLGNYLLERFKAKQTARAALIQVQVNRLASIWSRMAEIEQAITDAALSRGRIEYEENPMLHQLEHIEQHALDERVQARLTAEIMPGFQGIAAQITAVKLEIVQQRFWLGKKQFQMCSEHADALQITRERTHNYLRTQLPTMAFIDATHANWSVIGSRADINKVLRTL